MRACTEQSTHRPGKSTRNSVDVAQTTTARAAMNTIVFFSDRKLPRSRSQQNRQSESDDGADDASRGDLAHLEQFIGPQNL